MDPHDEDHEERRFQHDAHDHEEDDHDAWEEFDDDESTSYEKYPEDEAIDRENNDEDASYDEEQSEEEDEDEDEDDHEDGEEVEEEDEEDVDHEPLQGGNHEYTNHPDFNDSIDEFEGSHEEEISRLIASTNKLLADVGIERKKITSKEELVRVAPSMVVAVFEALYHTRIEDIERNPTTRKHYENNAQLVIDNLSDQINIPLTHISGKSIVEGDLRALSNLVYIFKRIVTLTTSSQQSLSTIESRGEGAEKHRARGGDSISTKDSFLDNNHNNNDDDGDYVQLISPKRSNLEPEASHYYQQRYQQQQQQQQENAGSHIAGQSDYGPTATTLSGSLPPSSNTLTQSLLDSYVQKSLRKVDQQLDLELRQHRATRRRKTLQFIKQSKSMQDNARRRSKALEAKQRKSVDDLVLQDRSYQLSRMNEEIVLLREVYASLYREEIKLKIDEEKLMRHRQEHARDYVQNHVENMERLFRERVEMLQEQEKNVLEANPPTSNELLEGVIHRIGDQQRQLMDKERATVQQQRDRMMMWRRESYQDLLSMLGAEKWSNNLRQYSVAGTAAASGSAIERRVQETVELLNSRTNLPPTSPLKPFKSHPILAPPKTAVPGSVYGLKVVKHSSDKASVRKHKKSARDTTTPATPTSATRLRSAQRASSGEAALNISNISASSIGSASSSHSAHGQPKRLRRSVKSAPHSATTAERRRQELRLMEAAFGKSPSAPATTTTAWEDLHLSSSPQRSAGAKRGGASAVLASPNNRKGSRMAY